MEDCLLYMLYFTNKAKLDTEAILKLDGVMLFFSEIDQNCYEAVRLSLEDPECAYMQGGPNFTRIQFNSLLCSQVTLRTRMIQLHLTVNLSQLSKIS